MPTYGGATFVRWGKKACSASTKLVYTGEMAGPDPGSSAGGANYQCLPSDPQYYESPNPSKANHSALRSVHYWVYYMADLKHLHDRFAPCAVCETDQQVTTLMIPAMTRCPTSEWRLEYSGYLMSGWEHTHGQQDDFTQMFTSASTSYVCVDKNADSQNSKTATGGNLIFPVAADCTGANALSSCPPYRGDGSALACVVCSK